MAILIYKELWFLVVSVDKENKLKNDFQNQPNKKIDDNVFYNMYIKTIQCIDPLWNQILLSVITGNNIIFYQLIPIAQCHGLSS